jgi:hypothetical protein
VAVIGQAEMYHAAAGGIVTLPQFCFRRTIRPRAVLAAAGALCLTLSAASVDGQAPRASDRPVIRIDGQLDSAAEFNRDHFSVSAA